MHPTIKRYLELGLSVLPVNSDKIPIIKEWKPYMEKRAGAEAEQWVPPIAVVAGRVSGMLVCLDFDDGGSRFEPWKDVVNGVDNSIIPKLVIQRTPSFGCHCIYRVDTDIDISTTKLASRPSTTEELANKPNQKLQVLIETRAEKGYFLVDPSPCYVFVQNNFENIPVLTPNEHDVLWSCAVSFDEEKKTEDFNPPVEQVTVTKDGIKPLDDYDSRNTPIETLKRAGWTISYSKNNVDYLKRPGKDERGISATWNHVPNRFYVFSTSTQFNSNTPYKPSAVLSFLEFGGDFSATARHLYDAGYGSRKSGAKKTANVDDVPFTNILNVRDVADRMRTFYKKSENLGETIGFQILDDNLRWGKGQLIIITGIPTAGKSELTDFILVNLAMKVGWNFIYFSPENYPLELHFNKLAEKFHKTNMWKAPPHYIEEAIDFIGDHFDFIDATEEELNLQTILDATVDLMSRKRVDGLIIDPWNEIECCRPPGLSEADYISTSLRRLRKFARKNKLLLIVVVHPHMMPKEKNSDATVVPRLYDCNGGAAWFNKADVGMVIHREFNATTVKLILEKIKYRQYGKPGELAFGYDPDLRTYTCTTTHHGFEDV